MEEVEGPDAVNGVCAVEKFDVGSVAHAQRDVVVSRSVEFVSDLLVGGDAVVVAAFDHKWAGADEPAHFGVVEGVAQVEFGHFVFAGGEVAVVVMGGGVFPDPFVEVSRADGEAVAPYDSGHTHDCFAPVAEAVENDAVRVYKVE